MAMELKIKLLYVITRGFFIRWIRVPSNGRGNALTVQKCSSHSLSARTETKNFHFFFVQVQHTVDKLYPDRQCISSLHYNWTFWCPVLVSRHCTCAYTETVDPACRPSIPQQWYWHGTVRQGSVRFNLREEESAPFPFTILLYIIYLCGTVIRFSSWHWLTYINPLIFMRSLLGRVVTQHGQCARCAEITMESIFLCRYNNISFSLQCYF